MLSATNQAAIQQLQEAPTAAQQLSQLAISTFDRYVDVRALQEKLVSFQPEGLTPHMFQYRLLQWARRSRRHVVLPEGNDDRILRAAAQLLHQDVVDLTILGDPAA
ncbi:MAG: phosphate acetyltransferase, partial [Hymenobacter sp.]